MAAVSSNRFRHARAGITLIELIIVVALLGIVLGFGYMIGREFVRRSDERSAVNTFQQAVWQGATIASARGFRTQLVRTGNELQVQRLDGTVLRSFEFATGVTLNVPGNPILVFTPPGRIDALPASAIQITADGTTYTLEISLIGEVRVQ